MVKIVEKSLEELAKKQRAEKMVKLANEHFKGKYIITSGLSLKLIVFTDPDNSKRYSLKVTFNDNHIGVSSKNYLEDALGLATLYEQAGEVEFTVRKDYLEPLSKNRII